MRLSLQFIGGMLVGFGLATFVFSLWVWTMVHHMFILGVSNWPALVLILMLPLLIVVLGIGIAAAGRNRKNQP